MARSIATDLEGAIALYRSGSGCATIAARLGRTKEAVSKNLSRWLYSDSVDANRCSKRFLKVTRFLNEESVMGG